MCIIHTLITKLLIILNKSFYIFHRFIQHISFNLLKGANVIDNNKEVIKYIASSVWSSWNPINWSPTMQLAAVSYIFSCLIDDTTAYLIKDTCELSNSQNFTFHSTKYPASRYVELAKEIPVCLKIFHKFDPEYVTDKSLTSHRFIDNFSNLLEHFKLTSIKDSTDSNPNYLIAWS